MNSNYTKSTNLASGISSAASTVNSSKVRLPSIIELTSNTPLNSYNNNAGQKLISNLKEDGKRTKSFIGNSLTTLNSFKCSLEPTIPSKYILNNPTITANTQMSPSPTTVYKQFSAPQQQPFQPQQYYQYHQFPQITPYQSFTNTNPNIFVQPVFYRHHISSPPPPLLRSSVSPKYVVHQVLKRETNKCHRCGTTETPEWRRGPNGLRTLCNACGLYHAKLVKKKGAILAAEDVLNYKVFKGKNGRRLPIKNQLINKNLLKNKDSLSECHNSPYDNISHANMTQYPNSTQVPRQMASHNY